MPDGPNPYRALPSVDALLADSMLATFVAQLGHARVRGLVQSGLERTRARIASEALTAAQVEAHVAAGELRAALVADARAELRAGLRPVINVAGVVLNTGLGRAPVHPEVAEAMARAAAGYCTLEVDRSSGKRNQRDARAGQLAAELVGAEAAICVNNCAAAVLLTLGALASGRGTALSRGELVEIGGSFRMPDVMRRAGTRLVEVGTTNRTRIGDYASALDDPAHDVGLLLKVHTSNYRVVGFTEEVTPQALAELGRERGLPSAYDLGSGRLEVDDAPALDLLGDELPAHEAVASGVDLVMFSGDKLFGGPQAGIVAGSKEAVARLRSDPVYRAVRLDKVALAGLERTLELYHAGRAHELPTRAMLLEPATSLAPVAERLAAAIDALPGFEARTLPGKSQPGSGSAPHVFVDTVVVRVRHAERSAESLSRGLREGEPSVFARIEDDALLLDPRTLLEGEEAHLLTAFEALAKGRP
ncbi:MAG: L-seryl-tRNA(Sec) selenium transferase [Planctomycetota bacterium]